MHSKSVSNLVILLVFTCPISIFAEGEYNNKYVVATRVTKVVESFDDPVWGNSKIYTLRPEIGPDVSWIEPRHKTFVRFGFNDNEIFIGMRCFDETGIKKISKNIDWHDGPVWGDDSVEIRLADRSTEKEYYRIIISAGGVVYDARGSDRKYELNWPFKVLINEKYGYWEVLLRVKQKTFKSKGNPGDIWYIKVFRNYQKKGKEKYERSALLSCPRSHSHSRNVSPFGKLVFSSLREAVLSHAKMLRGKLTDQLEDLDKKYMGLIEHSVDIRERLDWIISNLSSKRGLKSELDDQGLTHILEELVEENRNLRLSLRLYDNHLKVATKNQELLNRKGLSLFGYSVCSAYQRIFKDKPFQYKVTTEAKVSLAKGETEAFQVAIIPIRDLENLEVSLSFENTESDISQYIRIWQVDYVSIEKFAFSKIVNSNYFPDPLLPYQPTNVSVNEILPLWISIKLPEKVRAGEYRGNLILSLKEEVTKIPITINIWNFSISQKPNIVLPYSDTCTVLGVYTGYLREIINGSRSRFKIVDEEKYFGAVRILCRDLVEHKVTTCKMAVVGVYPWFIGFKKDGRWECDASFFKETVKVMLEEGIQMIVVGEARGYPNWEYLDAVLRSLSQVIKEENWGNIIWYKVFDEPNREKMERWIRLARIAKKHGLRIITTVNHPETISDLAPYLDAWSPSGPPTKNREHWENLREKKVPVWPYYNHMTYNHVLHGSRKAIWDMYHWKTDMYSYYAHNLWVYWNRGNPWIDMMGYSGLAENFMVYPPKDFPGYYSRYKRGKEKEFYILPSMRWEAITDAVEDYLYIKKLEELILHLGKKGKSQVASEGKEILEKWDKSFIKRSEKDIESEEFLDARGEMGRFIGRETLSTVRKSTW